MSVIWGMLTTFSFAGLDWYAIIKNRYPLKYFTKPAVMVWLIVWMGMISGYKGLLIWFGLAMFLSLAGDILLMLPGNIFLGGMLSFLAAHLCYIVGFNLEPLIVSPVLILLCILIVIVVFIRFREINQGVWQKTGARRMRYSTVLYFIAVTGMLLSTLSTFFRPTWTPLNAGVCFLGGALFFLSDYTLAWDRFVIPIPDGRLLVRMTYHTGQIFLLGGVFLHYFTLFN